MRFTRPDRLLLDPSDRTHLAVQVDLPGRGDLESAVDVPAELLQDLEGEREPRGGAADSVRIDRDVDGEMDRFVLPDHDPDDSDLRVNRPRDRTEGNDLPLAVA